MKITNERYKIKKELGKGASTINYLALDLTTGQEGVIKCLSLPMQINDSEPIIRRLSHQANILSHLHHPNIPEYIDFFTESDDANIYVCLVQKYIEGKSLRQLIEEGKHFTEQEIIQLMREFTHILEYIHSFSPPIIHRNIKPRNILIGRNNTVYLTELGLTRYKVLDHLSMPSSVMTESLGYVPPEVLKGKASPASDIYGLGASMIYALSHKDPIHMGTMKSRINFRAHVNISDAFAKILARTVGKNVNDRYQSARKLRRRLDTLKEPLSVKLGLPHIWKLMPKGRPAIILTLFIAYLLFVLLLPFIMKRKDKPPSHSDRSAALRSFKEASDNRADSDGETDMGKQIHRVNEIEAVASEIFYNRPMCKVRLLYNKMPFQSVSPEKPNFFIFHQEMRTTFSPQTQLNDDFYELWGIPRGKIQLSVEVNANTDNPNRFPGDFLYWGKSFDLIEQEHTIDVNLYQVIHLIAPQDNNNRMHYTGSSDCSQPAVYKSPVTFSWESLGEGVIYDYALGTVDCLKHLYHQGSVARGQTEDTSVTLSLAPNKRHEKYSFHLRAFKNDQLIGRLFVHDEGGSDWNYGFVINNEESDTVVRGRLFYQGNPLPIVSRETPYFWFRNEEKNVVENPKVEYANGEFNIFNLPIGRIGMSVTLNLNKENPVNYPGDLRAWSTFMVNKGENPELLITMQEVMHLTAPQDNGKVMELWGAECMDKITFNSPVRFRWAPLGRDVVYHIRITRMDCNNYYNNKETVTDIKISETFYTANLLPSEENECYGFHLYALKKEQTIGLLMTHGSNGMGWDYRFRVR
ncbi:MAG: serine/threonine protein kinase [bacterium]